MNVIWGDPVIALKRQAASVSCPKLPLSCLERDHHMVLGWFKPVYRGNNPGANGSGRPSINVVVPMMRWNASLDRPLWRWSAINENISFVLHWIVLLMWTLTVWWSQWAALNTHWSQFFEVLLGNRIFLSFSLWWIRKFCAMELIKGIVHNFFIFGQISYFE